MLLCIHFVSILVCSFYFDEGQVLCHTYVPNFFLDDAFGGLKVQITIKYSKTLR